LRRTPDGQNKPSGRLARDVGQLCAKGRRDFRQPGESQSAQTTFAPAYPYGQSRQGPRVRHPSRHIRPRRAGVARRDECCHRLPRSRAKGRKLRLLSRKAANTLKARLFGMVVGTLIGALATLVALAVAPR
jgi:hypothetical protein